MWQCQRQCWRPADTPRTARRLARVPRLADTDRGAAHARQADHHPLARPLASDEDVAIVRIATPGEPASSAAEIRAGEAKSTAVMCVAPADVSEN